MALQQFVDTCIFAAAAGGTVDFVVSAAVQGYKTPAVAGAVDAVVYKYRAQSADLSQWEEGHGAYDVATTTLARTVVTANSLGTTAKISFTGAPNVGIVQMSNDFWQSNIASQAEAQAGTVTDKAMTPERTTDAIAAKAVRYDAAQTLTAAQQAQARSNASAALKGHLHGLTLSNNVTDATNDLDIAVGEAASTETNPVLMMLASTLTKQLDATWAVGTNAGGRESGDTLGNKTYHVWLIQRSDTGVVDVLFSASATSPTMPTNYDRKRRIGSILRASSAIRSFVQYFDHFLHTTPMADVGSFAAGTANTHTLSLPTGLRVLADVTVLLGNSVTAQVNLSVIPGDLSAGGLDAQTAGINLFTSVSKLVESNASAQIKTTTSQAANNNMFIYTKGWFDDRGMSV